MTDSVVLLHDSNWLSQAWRHQLERCLANRVDEISVLNTGTIASWLGRKDSFRLVNKPEMEGCFAYLCSQHSCSSSVLTKDLKFAYTLCLNLGTPPLESLCLRSINVYSVSLISTHIMFALLGVNFPCLHFHSHLRMKAAVQLERRLLHRWS
jgi:hypothetical protein